MRAPPFLMPVFRALCLGAVLAAGLAVAVTTLELVENPGGIFRRPEGWRWDFLLETAWSWFLPTLLPAVVLAGLGSALRAALRRR
jgi:hypothetical protein